MVPGRGRWAHLERKVLPYLPYILLFVSFGLRLAAAIIQPLNLDEGSQLLESQLLRGGLIPFRDFIAREPVFTVLVAAMNAALGPGYVAGRLVAVAATTATTWIVYRLGTRLYDRRVGLLAMGVHAITPYFVYAGSILKLEPVATAFSAAAFLFATGASSASPWPSTLAGLIIGLAIHVRRIAIVLVPVVAYAAYLRSGAMRSAATALVGGLLTALLPIAAIALTTDLRWVWTVYGFGQGVYRDVQPLESVIAVLRTVIMFLTPHILLAAMLFILAFRRRLTPAFLSGLATLALVDIAILFGAGLMSTGFGFGVIWTPAWQRTVAVVSLGLCAGYVLGRLPLPASQLSTREDSADHILRLWMVALGVFYAAYVHIFVDYFMDFSAVLSLTAAAIWVRLGIRRDERDQVLERPPLLFAATWGLALLLPATYFLPSFNLYSPYSRPAAQGYPQYNLYERTYSRDLVRSVAAAIRATCPEESGVFTADPVFAVEAGRPVFRNLTYPIHYFMDRQRPFEYDPRDLLPPKDRLVLELVERRVPCLVVGERTRTLMRWTPPLRRVVDLLYHPENSFDDPRSISFVTLYVRRSAEPLPGGDPRSVGPFNFTPVRGAWKVSGSSHEADDGATLRSLAVAPVVLGDAIRVSAVLVVRGEGGFVLGYYGPDNYVGVRLIRSPDITGLNIFRVTPLGETSLVDVPTSAFVGRPIRLTVYAFPSFLEARLGDSIDRAIDIALPREGRIGLLANYGARFTDLTVRRDRAALLEPVDK